MKTLREWNQALFYEDTFSLYASHWQEEGNSTVFLQDTVASIEDAPCYLSKGKSTLGAGIHMDQPKKTGRERNTEERVLLLFCDPQYDIAIGDLLRITHQGETKDYTAGAPQKYPLYQEALVYAKNDA